MLHLVCDFHLLVNIHMLMLEVADSNVLCAIDKYL